MKSTATVFLGALFSLLCGASVAADMSTEESEIRAVYAATAKAVSEQSPAGAMAGYADDVLVYDISPPLRVTGKDHNIKTYETFFAATKGPYWVKFQDLKVKVFDPKNAYVTGYLEQGFTMNTGEKVSQRIRLTDVLEKRNGKWQIVHEHISAPVDMETGKADFNAPLSGAGKPFAEP